MASAPSAPAIVSLLTDFGLDDPYVGIMKAVLLRENPSLQLVDVSHRVPPQAVSVAAFWLARSYAWFPTGTVHLCVVDPGVGSERAPIAAHAGGHWFVGPDNGVFSEIFAGAEGLRVHRVDVGRLGLPRPSATFHGRDVFAPVAARLASARVTLAELGPPHEPLVRSPRVPIRDTSGASGSVLFTDRFGNLITDLPAELVQDGRRWNLAIGERTLRLVRTYADAEPGECVGLVSSFGTLEVARRDGDASAVLRLGAGSPVQVRLEEVD